MCECQDGFTRKNCEINMDYYEDFISLDGVGCVAEVTGFIYNCTDGFSALCEVNVDDCASSSNGLRLTMPCLIVTIGNYGNCGVVKCKFVILNSGRNIPDPPVAPYYDSNGDSENND
uniref:EGF-like domain-containing protein n=1 Tax=Branchiostoma floridae TaxID=7739 RepID=C3ZS66_BRAFL|eukprot:XP_002588587.1 hypothetical protein BRAFLDRAFT_107529 [Branchiostoma floridae]